MCWSLLKESLLHLAFPHVCEGCASDLVENGQLLCLRCLSDLPHTHFHDHPDNPVEKIFWGRLPLVEATAQYYFTKGSLVQKLLHSLKYRGNREAGRFLGRQMGHALAASKRFDTIEGLVPLPLFPAKERQRGFNQSALLCEGMATVLQKPVWTNILIRTSYTESQTKKGRVDRWQNMEDRFSLANGGVLAGRHVLLVDDVVTTGATLEAGGRVLLMIPGLQLSLAALCFSSGA
jgi:ComF family protein